MIEKNDLPEHRANLEALIHYYEEGGKVPEGEEEVWATEGQVSFRTRGYKSIEEMPEGLLLKLNYCDVSHFFCLCRFLFWPASILLPGNIANSSFVHVSPLRAQSTIKSTVCLGLMTT